MATESQKCWTKPLVLFTWTQVSHCGPWFSWNDGSEAVWLKENWLIHNCKCHRKTKTDVNNGGSEQKHERLIIEFIPSKIRKIFFVLCWGLTSQSTIFQSCRDGATASWVINQYFRGVKCLAQGHNTVAVGIETLTSRSGVRKKVYARFLLKTFTELYIILICQLNWIL